MASKLAAKNERRNGGINGELAKKRRNAKKNETAG